MRDSPSPRKCLDSLLICVFSRCIRNTQHYVLWHGGKDAARTVYSNRIRILCGVAFTCLKPFLLLIFLATR